jgi:16S rRNA (adenine1518-N6/adenine1519-N6)-dimethyltransferase
LFLLKASLCCREVFFIKKNLKKQASTFATMYTLKKSLGQHFLKDENICKKIVAAIQQYPHQKLLEVGPGGGALTKYLLEIPAIDFKAVELDTEKVDYLLATYSD